MKRIIIIGDGMADWPAKELGNKTLLQYAFTPYMDLLAQKGRNGLFKTVADGFHPGSEVANMAVMGYLMREVYEGRGVLEAASMGVELQDGDMAMRLNLVCIEGDILKNHSAGHITTEEAGELIDTLQKELGDDRVSFHKGVQYRHLIVIKGGDKRLKCTPPHDKPLHPYKPLMIQAEVPEAQATADLLNDLILRSMPILEKHPVNKRRAQEGKDCANAIWPWSPGYRPKMTPLKQTFPQIKQGSVISAVDLIRGIGVYAGLRYIPVEGATGLYTTNYEGKVQAALNALHTDDFVYLHIEAPDEAGHEGDRALKIRTIEDLDARVLAPIYQATKYWDEPVAIALLPDHPTPVELRTHTSDPIPFVIYYPGIEPDSVVHYDEQSAAEGGYGKISEDDFMKLFLNN
ncbi:MAG: cofactor-independent phosphoglycerate mutase [Bacteroidaceae bacterium]